MPSSSDRSETGESNATAGALRSLPAASSANKGADPAPDGKIAGPQVPRDEAKPREEQVPKEQSKEALVPPSPPIPPTLGNPGDGRWIVYALPADKPLKEDIYFGLIPRSEAVPADQIKLKNEAERTLTLLRAIFPDRAGNTEQQARFSDYFRKLLSLCQLGLVHANPEIATYALVSLHQEIVELEGGRIKNSYIRRLGIAAFKSSAVAAGVWIIAALSIRYGCDAIRLMSSVVECTTTPDTIALIPIAKTLAFVWIGSQLGSWASFNVRKVSLSVFDLSNLESDRVEPSLRLMFTGILSLVFSLIILTNMASVEIGGFDTKALKIDGLIAFLLGAFSGLSEQALSTAVTLKASETITSVTGKRT